MIWGCAALKVVIIECGEGNCFNTPLLFTAGCNHRKSKFGCHREEPCSSAQKAAARLCGAPDGPAPRRSPSGHSRTPGFHDRRRSGRRARPSSLSPFPGYDRTVARGPALRETGSSAPESSSRTPLCSPRTHLPGLGSSPRPHPARRALRPGPARAVSKGAGKAT